MKSVIVALCLLAPMSALAATSISIGNMYDFVPSDKSTFQKRIVNNGDSTAFVRVSVAEILYGADGKVREQAVDTNAVLHGKGNGLVASPGRMIVPAGGQQTSRIVYTGSREHERYYRVRYIPTEPEESDKSLAGSENISAGVKVLTGFGSIVMVRPAQAQYSTHVTQNGTQYEVRNGGNSTVIVENLQSCDAAYRECGKSETAYVRPGTSKIVQLTAGKHYRYTLVEGVNTKVVRVDMSKSR